MLLFLHLTAAREIFAKLLVERQHGDGPRIIEGRAMRDGRVTTPNVGIDLKEPAPEWRCRSIASWTTAQFRRRITWPWPPGQLPSLG